MLGLPVELVLADRARTGSRSRSCRSGSRRSSSSSRPTTRPASPASSRRKGEGFHHVCFEVANLTEALTRLELDGLELIDTAPRQGRRGPGRVPPPAVVPRGARRADRGAGRPGLGRASATRRLTRPVGRGAQKRPGEDHVAGAGRPARENSTIRPAMSRIQGFSSRGSRPSSSSSSSIQRPASAPMEVVRDGGDRLDPVGVDPLDDPLARVAGAVELGPGVEEVDRLVAARSRTGRPRGTGRARWGRGRRRGAGGRRSGRGPSKAAGSSIGERRRTTSRASPATRSIRLLMRAADPPSDGVASRRLSSLAGATVAAQPAIARSSAKKIMSRSPGERPASVSSAAASRPVLRAVVHDVGEHLPERDALVGPRPARRR